jgi:hypothetical protein
MLGQPDLHTALQAAVAKLLRPVVRLLLRHSVPYSAFESIAKRVYVDVAMTEFPLPGRKPTASRASILTGLTRKDVQRLLAEPAPENETATTQYSRAARVLTAWGREPEFRASHGKPRALHIEGENGFAGLVRRHSGDMPVRAMLDELVRLGAVQQREDGRVELKQQGYVPERGAAQKLGILGTDAAELIATIAHNVEHGETAPRYQRKVLHRGIPLGVLPEFRALSASQAQALLERFDAWLSVRDRHHLPAGQDPATTPTARVGVGIYYFEQHE